MTDRLIGTADHWTKAATKQRNHVGQRRWPGLGPLCGIAFVFGVSAVFWGGLAVLVSKLW
jgi:hypothetical protein